MDNRYGGRHSHAYVVSEYSGCIIYHYSANTVLFPLIQQGTIVMPVAFHFLSFKSSVALSSVTSARHYCVISMSN